MRRLWFAFAVLLVLTAVASAQGCGQGNPNCIVPTAPPGTSNNQAASTAFINDATNGIFGQPHTWTQLQSFIGSNTAAIIADGAQVVIQNSSVTAENILTPVTGGVVFDGNRSTVSIPASSSILSGNSYGAYIRNRAGTGSAHGGGVLYYGLATCGVSTTACWGANYRIIDNEDNLTHAFTGITLAGLEIDYQVTSPATVVGGITQYMLTTAVSSVGGGFACSIASGGTGKWTFCFISNDGASATGAYIGATAASGTSVASQPIQFGWRDSGGTARASNLFTDAAGQLTWPGKFNLNAAAGNAADINFQVNGLGSWQIGTLSNNHFFALDVANSNAFVWQMTSGGTFALTPPVSFAAGITASGLPTSAGGGGLFVCVDTSGVLYKKSTCP